MLKEFPPVFDRSIEVADVNEVERIRGKCPGVFGVVDLEGNIWRHPFQSVNLLPEENCLSRTDEKRGNPATAKTYQLGCMGLRSVPITSADGYALHTRSDNPSLILTNEVDSLCSVNGPYPRPSPHIQNPLNALLHR